MCDVELPAGGVINKKQRRDQEGDIVDFQSSNMALKSEVSLCISLTLNHQFDKCDSKS